jgi:hypothetical protein
MEEETINNDLNATYQMAVLMKKIRISEVKSVVQYKAYRKKKTANYDLITGRILKELSHKGLSAITHIYNAILQNKYILF